MVLETTDGVPSGASARAYPDYADAVQDVAALRAVPESERVDKQQRLVEDKEAAYRFDEQGTGADDGDLIIVPTVGSGRWFKLPSAGQQGSPGSETVIKIADDIHAILEAATDNSSFWLEDGTHTTSGLITITNKRGITLQGGFGAQITRSGSEAIFRIEGCEDLCMEGFTLSGDSTGAIVIEVVNAGAGSYALPRRHDYVGLRFDFDAGADGYSGIVATGSFEFCSVRECTFTDDVEDGIVVTGVNCEGTMITNNRMVTGHSGGNGIHVSLSTGEGIIVSGNVLEGGFYTGIRVETSECVVVRENVVRYSTNFGIIINSGADRAVIVNNIIYDPGTDGIAFGGDYGVVQGNEIYSAGVTGIDCGGAQYSSISANVVENGAGWGITLNDACSYCHVSDNVFYNNASGALDIDVDSANNTVDGKVENQLQTIDASLTTITLVPIPDDTVVWVEADVTNRRTNAAGRGKWKRGALVYRESAGSATIEGSLWTPLTIESDGGCDVTIDVNGNNARIRVTGIASHDLNWKSRHTVEERN